MAPSTVKTSRKRDLTARPAGIESYGVTVRLDGNDQALLDAAVDVAKRSLLGDLRHIDPADCRHRFEITCTPSGTYRLVLDGKYLASGRSRRKFLKFFDAMIRVTIGEHAVDRVFMHAGVVGWKGSAILLPADSFAGKSTLTAELVRQGAEYLSDDFAVLDADANVYPWARPLAMRTDEVKFRPFELTVSELGGRSAVGPLPVKFVILTRYEPEDQEPLSVLSPGSGVMQMMPFALSLNSRPQFSLKVLHNIATRAIIASGRRGSAEVFAKTLLNFVDKHVD